VVSVADGVLADLLLAVKVAYVPVMDPGQAAADTPLQAAQARAHRPSIQPLPW